MTEAIAQRDSPDESECARASRTRGNDHKFLMRSCLLFVGAFMYATHAMLDTLVADAGANQFPALRFGIVSPLLLAVAVGFVNGWFRQREFMACIAWMVIASGSILYMAMMRTGSVLNLYPPGVIVIVFSAWMLFLPSFRMTLAMTIILVVPLTLVVVVQEIGTTAIYANLYFIFISCTVLVIGMFFLENTERNQNSYRRELEETIDTLRASERRAVDLYLEAKQAEKAKDEFLAVVSHELRTPMNAIIGFSDIISSEMMGKIEPPQYQEYAVYINDSGKQLLSLINDILDVSRAEIDKMSFAMRDFDISATVDSAITACSADAEQMGVTIAHPSARLRDVTVKGDESRVLQAMTNIIGNAIKFSERGGIVAVDLFLHPDGSLHFTTSDDGIGISAVDIERIKQPFKQAESAHIRNSGGLGLGLAICNIVAKAHQGTLAIESVLGTGTTVSIVLPPDSVVEVSEPMTMVG